MAITYKNGHKIKYNEPDGKWHYSDGQIADENRKCPRCSGLPNKNGHDTCFNNLPGVQNACCGHGVKDAYIQFNDGTEIRFKITAIHRANNLFFIRNVSDAKRTFCDHVWVVSPPPGEITKYCRKCGKPR